MNGTEKLQLNLAGSFESEIVHFFDSVTGDVITSSANTFQATLDGKTYRFSAPLQLWKRPFVVSRLMRRFLRIDKCNAVPNKARDGLVIIYDGAVIFYDLVSQNMRIVANLVNSRNVLHGGVSVTDHGIYFGEYGHNAERTSVPVWRSVDGGRSWEVVYSFKAGSIKHVHGVYHDVFTDRFWVTCGDFDGECQLLSADPTFEDVKIYGEGSQVWRPVSLLFTPDHVIWAMDSPLQTCYLQILDRKSGRLEQGQEFQGPVWYTKQLTDGLCLLQTTVEVGPGVQGKSSGIFVSENLIDWVSVANFTKDKWPMPWFKYGVVGFADGPQSSTDFAVFGEGLIGLDGVAFHASLRSVA